MTTINMGLLIQSKALQSKLFEKANQVNIVEGGHADHNQQLAIISQRKNPEEKMLVTASMPAKC